MVSAKCCQAESIVSREGHTFVGGGGGCGVAAEPPDSIDGCSLIQYVLSC